MYRGFHISVRGASHLKEDLKCQDSSVHLIEETDGWALAVVADGHGGKPYFRSDIGSKFAVESAAQVARDYLSDMEALVEALHKNPERILHNMEASILSKWNSAIQEYDAEHFELTEWEQEWCREKGVFPSNDNRENLYGTTLVMTLLSPQFAIGIQNGDGACVAVYDDGRSEFFIPQEEGEQLLNVTNSLCSSKAMEHFLHRCDICSPICEENDENTKGVPAPEDPVEMSEATALEKASKLPSCLIVSTDGLINSCVSPEDFLKFNQRVLSLMDEDGITEKLETHLSEERSAKGSMDDISIALTFDQTINLADFRLN